MTDTTAAPHVEDVDMPRHGNAYSIFILVLTIFSLAVMVLLILPFDDATLDVLRFYDNAICVVFLIDFAVNLMSARSKRGFFIGDRGWLDLLGSIPSFGVFPAAGLFRIARLSRLARITRLLRGNNRKALVDDVLNNRGQYAVFITILAGFIVLSVSTVMMVQFESQSPDANITTGGDALWWGFTTITTVGYGDQFPVTPLGRATAVLVMFAGVGIIGSLASILASFLVPPPKTDPATEPAPAPALPSSGTQDGLLDELAAIRSELADMRSLLSASGSTGSAGSGAAAPSPGTET
jgi:voltage-gated potassium channel